MMKRKAISLFLAIVLVFSMTVCVFAAEDTGKVVITLDQESISVGDNISVQVSVKNISSKKFYASDVEIYYNPTVLQCVQKPEMSQILADSGIMKKVYDKIDNNKGLVRYTIGMDPEQYLEEGFEVASGELSLFTISFEVIGQGDINLQVAEKETAPAYEETFPAGAKIFLGSAVELADLNYEKVSYIVGEKGDALITEILPIDPITVPFGTEEIVSLLPSTVSARLDDGTVKEFGMTWTGYMSSYDGNTPGKYLFRGTLQNVEGYQNNQGLFSLLEVTVSAEEDKADDTVVQKPDDTKDDVPQEPEASDGTQEPGTEQPQAPVITFNDLDSVPWAAEKIVALAADGVVSGIAEGVFSPNGEVTRAQFVAMLTRAFGLLDEEATCDFSDVSEEQWYYTAVASAKKCGITAGYDDNTFRPDALITRQEMAAMAYRTAGIAGLTIPETAEKIAFIDEADIADYAKDAISAMQMGGVINGMGDGQFGPKENATRAQAAVIIYQLYQFK
ncbi:MAG: hypothetical protein E7399_00430 [Ruminococcaceae bacterium]|nr:hypothetical protein [Oscillospiraceae bacterium]